MFLHIPKTGGTTIETVLGALGIDVGFCHKRPFEFRKKFVGYEQWHTPPAAEVPDSFAIVRNPYSRAQSEFLWRVNWLDKALFHTLRPGYDPENCEKFENHVKAAGSRRPQVRVGAVLPRGRVHHPRHERVRRKDSGALGRRIALAPAIRHGGRRLARVPLRRVHGSKRKARALVRRGEGEQSERRVLPTFPISPRGVHGFARKRVERRRGKTQPSRVLGKT